MGKRYRWTVEYEADNDEVAANMRDEAMQYFQGTYLDGDLEVQVNEDHPDEAPMFDPIEA